MTVTDENLQRMRKLAHDALDALWKMGFVRRERAYNWLARKMDMRPQDCHISKMSVQQCREVIDLATDQRRKFEMRGLPKNIRPHRFDPFDAVGAGAKGQEAKERYWLGAADKDHIELNEAAAEEDRREDDDFAPEFETDED